MCSSKSCRPTECVLLHLIKLFSLKADLNLFLFLATLCEASRFFSSVPKSFLKGVKEGLLKAPSALKGFFKRTKPTEMQVSGEVDLEVQPEGQLFYEMSDFIASKKLFAYRNAMMMRYFEREKDNWDNLYSWIKTLVKEGHEISNSKVKGKAVKILFEKQKELEGVSVSLKDAYKESQLRTNQFEFVRIQEIAIAKSKLIKCIKTIKDIETCINYCNSTDLEMEKNKC